MYFYEVLLKDLRDGDIWVTTEECFKAISRLGWAQDHKCCFQENNDRDWDCNNLSTNLFTIACNKLIIKFCESQQL